MGIASAVDTAIALETVRQEGAGQPEQFIKRLWSLCNVLRGDGISYNQYISELTYLLFLKVAKETGSEELLPIGYRWDDLQEYQGQNLLGYYQEMLTHLGAAAESEVVRHIYAFPTTVFSHSENLAAVINGIDALNWHSLSNDSFGVIYEGLLAKNSEDTRGGAGQYFTPRALVDCMVTCLGPAPGELIQDPSVGTGGFLISADHHVRSSCDPTEYAVAPPMYEGMEIERGTYRLCLMNVFLHRMNASIYLGDTLTSDATALSHADVILANPPFGTRAAGARVGRGDLAHTSSNRQLRFLQHIYRALKPGGRAAVVLPDNVLFEGGQARRVREELMDLCNLHTILKLPTGIFYAQNVSTHVLFFTRNASGLPQTGSVWVYDLRSKMPRFGKRRTLSLATFAEFIDAYGSSPLGNSPREESAGDGRFRSFSREQVLDHDGDLATGWLEPSDATGAPGEDAEALALQMIDGLGWATRELRALVDVLATAADRSGPGE